ncbi:serine/threonine protein kinase [Mycobacterium sp. MYCO198283]|uniref:serine/threonine-protein kinase n=1 Tax=Mycobacterium sp. MYCO198283 TaxID=2883505 RepID=UPI001E62E3CA|nr:serine/threonine-protein kinase [Mycobacterium sp. MYCO198283]MCG5431269.1 serine/threonine protein kinase [Mycobacterium sp. MYCO198283]
MTAPELLGGRYELRGVLGRGGMAEVRDGWDIRLGRPVAVKLMYPQFAGNPENRMRFEAEARAVAGLNHPNIVAIHDIGEQFGAPFIVMERLPGVTLADEIARGPLAPDRVRAVLQDVLTGLEAAHAAGILHRDIKPANILFAATGQAKIADFGVAKLDEVSHTMTGQVMGTGAYLSPERLKGLPATPADDVYSLGVVGYEALTGRRMFPQDNLVVLARAICDERPPPLAALRPDVDPALVAVIDRATAPDVRHRFATAAQMRAALAAPVAGPPPPVTPPAVAAPPPGFVPYFVPPPRRRTGLLATVAVALTALFIAVVVVLVTSTSSSSDPPAGTSPRSTSTVDTTSGAPLSKMPDIKEPGDDGQR